MILAATNIDDVDLPAKTCASITSNFSENSLVTSSFSVTSIREWGPELHAQEGGGGQNLPVNSPLSTQLL